MMILVEHGTLYSPILEGKQSILLVNDRIVHVGHVDRTALDRLGLPYDYIDATDGIITPGLIDPHQHLLGGSGEQGLSTQSPELFLTEIVAWGTTTVCGVLGVDTTMKTIAGLLAKVKGFKEQGLSAYLWSGGYNVPPTTVLNSIREDMLFIEECIGAGEVAIADHRSLSPGPNELAKLILDTHIGGMLSGKAGITHFHVGEGRFRLRPLQELLTEYTIEPGWFYPTHVQRTDALLEEAIALQQQGVWLDFDTSGEDFAERYQYFLDHRGNPKRLTISSDSDSGTPAQHFEQLCRAILHYEFPIEQMLSLCTANVAEVLCLRDKGKIQEGFDADVLVLDQDSLAIREVIARGKRMVRDGRVIVQDRFLQGSSRAVALIGEEASPAAIGSGVHQALVSHHSDE